MSDDSEFLTGQAGLEHAAGFEPMLPPEPLPEEPKEREYTSDDRDLRKAARELVKERGPRNRKLRPVNMFKLAATMPAKPCQPTAQ